MSLSLLLKTSARPLPYLEDQTLGDQTFVQLCCGPLPGGTSETLAGVGSNRSEAYLLLCCSVESLNHTVGLGI